MGCNTSKSNDIQASKQRVKQPNDTTPNQPNHPSTQTPTKSTDNTGITSPPMSTGKKLPGDQVHSVAESYTDLRIKENEMFQNIINKTAMNFIDIAQSPALMQQHGMNIHDHFQNYDDSYDNNHFDDDQQQHQQQQQHQHMHHHHHHMTQSSTQHAYNQQHQQSHQEQDEAAEETDAILNAQMTNVHLFGLPVPSTRQNSRQLLTHRSITDDTAQMMERMADWLHQAREGMKINDEDIPPLVVQLPEIDEPMDEIE